MSKKFSVQNETKLCYVVPLEEELITLQNQRARDWIASWYSREAALVREMQESYGAAFQYECKARFHQLASASAWRTEARLRDILSPSP